LAKVHRKAVIATAVDDEQARKALGHKRIGNDWFTAEELKQANDEQKQGRIALKKWMPVMRKLVSDLQSHDTQRMIEATRTLENINDESAVDSLMYAALQVEPSIALPIVERIKSIRCKDSCLALCEIAVSDPTSETGRLAIQGLKEYDEHFYVQELLQMIAMPVKLQQEMVYLPNGALAIRRAYSRETADTKEQVEVLKLVSFSGSTNFSTYNSAIPPSTVSYERGSDGWTTVNRTTPDTTNMAITVYALNPQAVSSTKKLSDISVRKSNRNAKQSNQIQNHRERNAKMVLSAITGVPADQPTETFWNWWPSFNESATNVKAISHSYVVDNSDPVNLTSTASGVVTVLNGTTSSTSRYHSCLVAGTLIQTSEGLKNVESIQVGDFITSTNVKTGEICLRPATHTTVRTADSTYLINVGTEAIRATGGHSWWVVGRGWVRSRDLAAGQYMRTGNASVKITNIEKIDSPINVYNMIVDENHTYFVGKNRLLSWDVTSLQPTLQTAPGQKPQSYLVKK
jgi:hypothetical protein